MKLYLPFLALALGSGALAQSVIDFTKLPECAKACTILQQADTNCVPPAAPVTNQGIYQSCVCQSALLTGLHSSGAQCQQFCAPDDATAISQYYIALCNSPPVEPAPTGTETTTSTAPTGTNTVPPGTAKGTTNNEKKKESWVSEHWPYLVMIIVIVIAIIVFWVGGVCLRRHIHRKREAKAANMAGTEAPHVEPNTPQRPAATANGAVTSSPMTMPSTRNPVLAINLDGGVGGIAPPRSKLRSRTNTLQSLGQGNSRTASPAPVVWGPHQHQAHAARNGSPSPSIPPSPTVGRTPPHPLYRHNDASMSEPRFVHYKATPTSVTVQPALYRDTSDSTLMTNHTAPATDLGAEIYRPATAREDGRAGSIGRPVSADYHDRPELQGHSAEFFDAVGPGPVGRGVYQVPQKC